MKTPIGYIVTILIQSIELYAVVFIWLSTVLIPVAHCVLIVAFCTDLKNELRIWNEKIKIESKQKNPIPSKIKLENKQKLCKILRFYGDAKQLSGNIHHIIHNALHI